jgi:hypothetical protein
MPGRSGGPLTVFHRAAGDLTQAQRDKIFGGNLRQIAEPIFRKKGYQL